MPEAATSYHCHLDAWKLSKSHSPSLFYPHSDPRVSFISRFHFLDFFLFGFDSCRRTDFFAILLMEYEVCDSSGESFFLFYHIVLCLIFDSILVPWSSCYSLMWVRAFLKKKKNCFRYCSLWVIWQISV